MPPSEHASESQSARASYDRISTPDEIAAMTEAERAAYDVRTKRHRDLQKMFMERMGVSDEASVLAWVQNHASRFRAILVGDAVLRDACESGLMDRAFTRLLTQWERFRGDAQLTALLARDAYDAAMEYVRGEIERPLH